MLKNFHFHRLVLLIHGIGYSRRKMCMVVWMNEWVQGWWASKMMLWVYFLCVYVCVFACIREWVRGWKQKSMRVASPRNCGCSSSLNVLERSQQKHIHVNEITRGGKNWMKTLDVCDAFSINSRFSVGIDMCLLEMNIIKLSFHIIRNGVWS